MNFRFLFLVLALIFACAVPSASAGTFSDVDLLDKPADDASQLWPFDVSLSGTFDKQINDGDLTLWGARLDAQLMLADSLTAGLFYNIAWPETGGGDPYHRVGLSGRYAFGEFFGATPYLDLGGGLLRHGTDSDAFLFSGLGLEYPLSSRLRADLAAGVYWHIDEPQLDTIGARLGLSYSF